jgi:hypothetical protein
MTWRCHSVTSHSPGDQPLPALRSGCVDARARAARYRRVTKGQSLGESCLALVSGMIALIGVVVTAARHTRTRNSERRPLCLPGGGTFLNAPYRTGTRAQSLTRASCHQGHGRSQRQARAWLLSIHYKIVAHLQWPHSPQLTATTGRMDAWGFPTRLISREGISRVGKVGRGDRGAAG